MRGVTDLHNFPGIGPLGHPTLSLDRDVAVRPGEKTRGRVPAGADTDALALVVVSVLHHVALTSHTDLTAEHRIQQVIGALTDGFPAAAPS